MARKKIPWQSRLFKLFFPLILIILTLYILNQMLSGERNMATWHDLREQVNQLEKENLTLRQQVEGLEDRVYRLQDGRMDEDYLEEKMREYLPITKKGEKVILLSPDSY